MSKKDTSVDPSAGIYAVRNKVNNKMYIGQSGDLHWRKIHHKSDLKHNRCINRNLQEEYNKMGHECFEFIVLEYCPRSDLDEKEAYYVDFYKSNNPEYGYNFYAGGKKHGAGGYTHTEEELNKMKQNGVSYGRPIKQIFPDGTFKIWPSITRARKDLGLSSNGNLYSGIKTGCIRYGCHWEYV